MPNEHDSQRQSLGAWASLLLRLAIASLFLSAAVGKLKDGGAGIRRTVEYFQKTFEGSWLPDFLVTIHGYATPFIESLIVLWLVTGLRLRIGWIVTTLFVITLSFGMAVAKNYDTAADNYTYALICVAGLYLSRFDRYNAETLLRGRSKP